MAESVIRVERERNFTTMQNDMLRDQRLSLKTKGLFAIILSLPDDWKYCVSGLATVAGVGKDAIRSALGEMEVAGYLTREQAHTDSGKFGGNVYVIREVSSSPLSGNPTTVKPMTDEPSTENPTLLNKDIQKTESITPHKPPKGRDELSLEIRSMLNDYIGGDKELAESMQEFIDFRLVSKKARNTPRAIKMLLAELEDLSGGDREKRLRIVRNSVLNGWIGVFPLKGGPVPQRQTGGERLVV